MILNNIVLFELNYLIVVYSGVFRGELEGEISPGNTFLGASKFR